MPKLRATTTKRQNSRAAANRPLKNKTEQRNEIPLVKRASQFKKKKDTTLVKKLQNLNSKIDNPFVRRAAQWSLSDLPDDIIDNIMCHLNLESLRGLRATSKQMRDLSDTFIRHEFLQTLNRYKISNPNSYECAVLKTIELATEVYLRANFKSAFCGCVLILKSDNGYNLQIDKIITFLSHFYETVDTRLGDQRSQFSRLLYNLTLMRFFQRFDSCTVISSSYMRQHLRILIELKGPWFGVVWATRSRNRDQPDKRGNLLIILAQLLIANITGKFFKRVLECKNEVYVFGNTTKVQTSRIPKTLFTFTVHGSKKICSLFRSCLESSNELVWPPKWPRDQFTVNLDIKCTESQKWGCSGSQHMEFGPFQDICYIDKDEDFDAATSFSHHNVLYDID